MSHQDSTLGAMLGLAVGDALGAQVEFADPEHARAVSERGLEMVDSGYWAAGQWTDDTALALELADGIAEHGALDVDDVARRYIRWATTDGRGIGRATRSALVGASDAAEVRRRASGFHTRTGMGAGNGTVMRCAPIGLAAQDFELARTAALADARLTHGYPAAAPASAAFCAALLALRERGDALAAARAEAQGHSELERALELAAVDERDALSTLAAGPAAGTCWTTLAVGLCALAWLGDYKSGVAWAISLGGDTDTNARRGRGATRLPSRPIRDPCSLARAARPAPSGGARRHGARSLRPNVTKVVGRIDGRRRHRGCRLHEGMTPPPPDKPMRPTRIVSSPTRPPCLVVLSGMGGTTP
jgi:ADP-ribosylglycohydrolase